MMMRAFTLVLGSLISWGVLADDTTTNQESTSIASPSSTMSNVQVNTGDLAESHYGGGVSCAEPTMSVSATRTPHMGNYYTAGVSFPMTGVFETSDCDKAARLQNQLRTWELIDRKQISDRKEEMHQVRIEQEWLKVADAQANLATVCARLHKELSANPVSELWAVCSNFAPITANHHAKPINPDLIPVTHKRISANQKDRK